MYRHRSGIVAAALLSIELLPWTRSDARCEASHPPHELMSTPGSSSSSSSNNSLANSSRADDIGRGNNYKYAVIGNRSAGLNDTDICKLLQNLDPETDPDLKKAVFIDTRDYSRDRNALSQLSYEGDNNDYRNAGVTSLDVHNNRLTLTNGECLKYDKCLINLGSRPFIINGDIYFDKDCHLEHLIDATDAKAFSILEAAVLSGKHVTILGSDNWACADLASSLSETLLLQRALKSSKTNKKLKQSSESSSEYVPEGGITILTSSGPALLSHALPAPIAKDALTKLKRLSANTIEHCPYSQIRFISAVNKDKVKDHGYFSILMGSTYDNLNTSSFNTDFIVYHPGASGIPVFTTTTTTSNNKKNNGNNNHHSNYNLLSTWDSISRAGLETDESTGALVVNRSLQACDGVYVVGESANVFSSRLGRLVHNSKSNLHAMIMQASRNMTRGGTNASSSGSEGGTVGGNNSQLVVVYDHIPVSSYNSRVLGLNFLFVGSCSVLYESFGYSWHVDGDRSQPQSYLLGSDKINSSTSNSNRSKNKKSNSNSIVVSNKGVTKVQQKLGVIFYVESQTGTDVIKGVLVTGLPPPPITSITSLFSPASNGMGGVHTEGGVVDVNVYNAITRADVDIGSELNYYNITSYVSSQFVGRKLSDLLVARHLIFPQTEGGNSNDSIFSSNGKQNIFSQSEKNAFFSRLAGAILSPALSEQSLLYHKEAIMTASSNKIIKNSNNYNNYNNNDNNSDLQQVKAPARFGFEVELIVPPNISNAFISGMKSPKVTITPAVFPDREPEKSSRAVSTSGSIPLSMVQVYNKGARRHSRAPTNTPHIEVDGKLFKEY